MARLKLSKQKMVLGAGVGTGMVQTVLMKAYVDQYGPLPFIGQYLPVNWNLWSSTGNIIIGGIAFGISQWTKLLKGNVKTFVAMYGFTVIIGGILNGIFPAVAPPAARFRAAAARAAAPYRAISPGTPTGIPAQKILA